MAKYSKPLLAGALLLAAAAARAELTVAAFGDSLMDAYGLDRREGFVQRLEERLAARGLAVAVADEAVSGDTTADGLTRAAQVAARRPDAVILALGANDMLRFVQPAVTERNLAAIIELFQDAGIPVFLVGMQATLNYGPAYKKRFDALYPSLADRYGLPMYPFLLDGVALNAALNLADGIHPNPAGIDVIVDRFSPSFISFLEDLGG